jgi:alanine racemase
MRSTWLEVSIDALKHNLSTLSSLSGIPLSKTFAVVKANAYGHGAIPVARALMQHVGISHFAVATAWEAMHLYSAFSAQERASLKSILVLGSLPLSDIPALKEFGATSVIQPTICTLESLHEYLKQVPNAAVHLKVDSGMRRVGKVTEAEFRHAADMCAASPGARVAGVYTHFADSAEDFEGTRAQIAVFSRFLSHVPQLAHVPKHVSNSAACLNASELGLKQSPLAEYARPGICMYGLDPGTPLAEFSSRGLVPVGRMLSRPTQIKAAHQGERIGYSGTYTVKARRETIATFSLGYADGFNRLLSSRTVIRRLRDQAVCELVGRVSMDQTTFRVPDDTTYEDVFEVVSADYDPETSMGGRARLLGTISYEVATSIAERVPRRYISQGRVIDELRR